MDIDNEFSDKNIRDLLLVELAKKGDEKAFAELMQRYKKPLYQIILEIVVNKDDAEDLTIETFSKVFNSLNNINRELTFRTWLFRTATNASIDFKKKSKEKNIKGDNEEHIGFDRINEILKNNGLEIIQECLRKLPLKYQILIKLRYLQAFSYAEICVEIGAPLGTVKAQLHRARELLNDLLNDNNNDSDILVSC